MRLIAGVDTRVSYGAACSFTVHFPHSLSFFFAIDKTVFCATLRISSVTVPYMGGECVWNPVGKRVECKECGRGFVCGQWDDYYNSTGPEDGVCEKCLLREAGITEIITLAQESPFSLN